MTKETPHELPADLPEVEPRKEFWVTCKPCRFSWIAAYLPMKMHKIARLMHGLHCPKCSGGVKGLFVATAADIRAALSKSNAVSAPDGGAGEPTNTPSRPRQFFSHQQDADR